MEKLTNKQLEKAIKDTLFKTPEKKAQYENKKPTQEQLNQKWKLEKRAK